jgi:acetyl esterase/lipase
MRNSVFLLLLTSALWFSCEKEQTGSGMAKMPAAKTIKDVSYGSDALEKMDIYLPAGRSTDSTILLVLIHGGAWLEGDKHDFDSIVTILEGLLPGDAIANINYRLATQTSNHFPAQEEDANNVIQYLERQDSAYQISHNIIVLGASAGAHLAMLEGYKHNDGNIKAVVDFYGPTDLADMYNTATDTTVRWGLSILLNGTPATNASLYQQSSPINFVTAQSPPTFIAHGGLDSLVNISQSIALKNKLQSLSVPVQMVVYPKEGHGWGGPDLLDAIGKAAAFIKTH